MKFNVGDDVALAFVLLFARSSGLTLALPTVLGVAIPVRIRVLLSALLAGSLMPLAKVALPAGGGLFSVMLMMVRELAMGTTLAFAAAIVIGAVVTAGDVLGNGMELHGGAIVRGSTPMPNVLGDALTGLGGMLFFIGGLHRTLLLGLGRSLRLAPLGVIALPGVRNLLAISERMFVLALELALPVLIPLFILSVAQGVLARLAPQLNMLMVAPAAILAAGLMLLLMDSHGLMIGIMRAWEMVIDQALNWSNG
ncbi:MAG TPA: flagellar biosynthetic protein FliR [Candidatus Binataceae bacterium]|nr:flagellar biosynthetic protein FliR [Candidatus Binataceae bacterium]